MPNDANLYPTKFIAELFSVSERWVNELTRGKILRQAKRGLYDLMPTVQAYVRHLNSKIRGRESDGETEGNLKLRKARAEVEEREAKARKARYQADVMAGSLLKLEEVERQWIGRYVEVKAAMLEFPKRAAFRFTNPEVREQVEEEANAFVIELLERYSRDGVLPDGAVGTPNAKNGPDAPEIDDGQRMGGRA